MALPTLSKTYTIDANRAVAAQGTIYKTKMVLMTGIKDSLVAGGWTVDQVCNARFDTASPAPGPPTNPLRAVGSVGGAWVDFNSFTQSSYGIADQALPDATHFPWIVLKNSGLGGGNYQLLISSNNQQGNANLFIQCSPSVGFSGGTVAANPTASDAITLINTTTACSGVDAAHKIDTWVSTDLKVTRVIVWRATTNMCCFWEISEPKDVVSGWTNPSVTSIFAATAGIAVNINTLCTASNRGKTTQSGTISIGWTGEGDRSGSTVLAEVTDVGTVVNGLTSNWPFFGIGLYSKTTGSKGRHGSLYDIYWKPGTTAVDADTFPNNPNARLWVCAGPVILPWKGDATVMALT